MNRNLGAETTNYNLPSARGLYYQWGRKDPFIYPSTNTIYIGTAPAVYHNGFEYKGVRPENYSDWEEIMTIDYSIGHPTSYIYYYQEPYDEPGVSDWLCYPNQNLWGNASTRTTINKVSSKSIYDPCPPGWRVPDIEDFTDVKFKGMVTPNNASVYFVNLSSANYPLGGMFNGAGYLYNGTRSSVYTCSPYIYNGVNFLLSGTACSSFGISSSSAVFGQYFRYAAYPVRCRKE